MWDTLDTWKFWNISQTIFLLSLLSTVSLWYHNQCDYDVPWGYCMWQLRDIIHRKKKKLILKERKSTTRKIMCINYTAKQLRNLFGLLNIITDMGLWKNLPVSSKVKSLHSEWIKSWKITFPEKHNLIYGTHLYGAGGSLNYDCKGLWKYELVHKSSRTMRTETTHFPIKVPHYHSLTTCIIPTRINTNEVHAGNVGVNFFKTD